jgi:hypothetical protein
MSNCTSFGADSAPCTSSHLALLQVHNVLPKEAGDTIDVLRRMTSGLAPLALRSKQQSHHTELQQLLATIIGTKDSPIDRSKALAAMLNLSLVQV